MCQRPTPYTSNAHLSPLVQRAHREGDPPAELVTILTAIAEGVHTRFGFLPESDDFVQECLAKALKALPHADPAKNLFGFFTTTFVNLGKNLRAKHDRRAQADAAFRAVLTAGGADDAADLASLSPGYRRLHRLLKAGKLAEAKRVAVGLLVTEPPPPRDRGDT